MSTETEPRTPTENDGWWSVSGWGTLHRMKPKTYSVTQGETMWRTLCGRDAPSSRVHRETVGDGDRCGQCERRQTASGREMTDLLTALRTSLIAARQRGAISDDEWDEHFSQLADPLDAERARGGETP